MKYALSGNGLKHLVNPTMGEFTLCGDAFDIGENLKRTEDSWKNIKCGPVNCPRCTEIIKGCRGVKTSQLTTIHNKGEG